MRYALAVTALLALASCSSPEKAPSGNLDQNAQWACDDLANYMAEGAPEETRHDVLSEVVANAKASELESIQFAGKNLENLIDAEGWESGADVLAGKCTEEGWVIS